MVWGQETRWASHDNVGLARFAGQPTSLIRRELPLPLLGSGAATADWVVDGFEKVGYDAPEPIIPASKDEAFFNFQSFWKNWTVAADDVFGDAGHDHDGDLFGSADIREWTVLLATLGALLILDNLVLKRLEGWSGHVVIVIFWFCIAMIFCGHYGLEFGYNAAADWLLGYLLEVMLSIDNVFVFHLVFESFRPPLEQQHKAMYFGIIGALGARLLLFLALGAVVHTVRWVRLAMGLLLIYSGIKATMDDDDEEEDPSNNFVMRCLHAVFGDRMLSYYDPSGYMFVRDDAGRICATMLLPLIICVEIVDVVFAMDSLSAKVAQIKNQYAAYSSSAFAILMLRAVFFLLRDCVDYFTHVKYGLCIILVFIGLELLAADFVTLPSSALCLAITAVFGISLLSSIRAKLNEDAAAARRNSNASAAPAAEEADETSTSAAADGDGRSHEEENKDGQHGSSSGDGVPPAAG